MSQGASFSKSSLSEFLIKIAIISLFLFSIRVVNSPVIFLSHLVMSLVVLLALFNRQLRVNITILWLLILLACHGLIGVVLGTTSLFLLVENFLRLLIYYVAFSSVLMGKPANVKTAVLLYLKIGSWVSALGLLALASYLVGFSLGYDYSWFLNSWHHIPWGGHFGLPRAQSIFGEPSHAVYVLGPATFFAIGRLLGSHQNFLSYRAAITIIAFIFMTNSTTAYATLPFALIFNLRLSFKQALLGGVTAIMVVAFLAFSSDLNFAQNFLKIELIFDLINDDGQTVGVSGSSYAAYVGNVIAIEIFRNTGGFGGGIGSFEASFDQVMGSLKVAQGNIANIQTGGSLMARSVAELGLFGIGLWLIVIVMGFHGLLTFKEPYRAIHAAMFVGLLPFFYRFGTYETFGLAFFVTVLIINAQHAAAQKKSATKRIRIYAFNTQTKRT